MAFNRGEVSTAVDVEVSVVNCTVGSACLVDTSQAFSAITHIILLEAAFRKTHTRMMFALPIATAPGNYDYIIRQDSSML